jgi:hypothetical protein
MKSMLSEKMEAGRIREGNYASSYGMAGAFKVPLNGNELAIISSGVDREHNWEHVSVSLWHRTPNWMEMCWVKDQFWDEEECVMQLHPPRSKYVNCHPHCLHLWKPIYLTIPMPPSLLIGPK